MDGAGAAMGSDARGSGLRGAATLWLLLGALSGCLWLAPDADAATKPRLRITAKPAVVTTGARIVVSGRVVGRLPKPAGSLRVRVQRRVGTRWRNGASKRLARKGRFAVAWRAPSSAGRLRLRLRLLRGKRVLASSRAWRLMVTRPVAPDPGGGPAAPGSGPAAPGGGPPGPAPASTLVISPATVADAPAPGQPGLLVLSGAVAVKAGDVLASGIGAQTPYGFLLKATAVRVEGGRTLVDVVPATLLEAIPAGEIHESFTSSRAGRERSARAHFREAVACSAGGTVTIEGSADLGSPVWSIDADWGLAGWGFPKLKSVKATASMGASAHASAEATGTASCTVGPIKILETKFAPITFTIGPIPVVIVPELEIDLDGLGQIDANVATSVDASITATAGAKYQDGKLSPIAELEKTFEHQPPDPQATAKLTATLSSELEAKFYGAGGPAVDLNAGLEMNADSDAADPWWTLDAPIAVTAGLEIDALDIEAGPITVYEKKIRLAEAAPRGPVYRVVDGALHSTASMSGSCSGNGTLGCTGDATSESYSQSTDASFSVASPSPYQAIGEFAAPAAIESWDHAYSWHETWQQTGGCHGTNSSVDSGPLNHTGGTNPSVYSLIGTIDEPAEGAPATRPQVALRVNTEDLGNYMVNQPALGITWPSSFEQAYTLIHSTDTSTIGPAECGDSGNYVRDQPVLARNPFDPLYSPFGADIDRTDVNDPTVYGAPVCSGRSCVTRVSGMTGFDDTKHDGVPSTASVRVTWWFDVETCQGCE